MLVRAKNIAFLQVQITGLSSFFTVLRQTNLNQNVYHLNSYKKQSQ